VTFSKAMDNFDGLMGSPMGGQQGPGTNNNMMAMQSNIMGGPNGMMGAQNNMVGGQNGMIMGQTMGMGMQNSMLGGPNNMGMPQPNASMMPITPTQTTEASQQANKTQVMNQFQALQGQQVFPGMGGPSRPAPGLPQQNQGAMFMPQQQNFLAPPSQPTQPLGSSGNLILSNSFTEPGPVDQDPMADPFASTKSESTSDIPDAGSTFYIDENEIASEKQEAEKEDTVKDEGKDNLSPEAPKEVETVSPQPKASFWSRWSRSKDSGSKENIIDENEKKSKEKDADEGRGGNEQKFLGDGQSFKGKLIGVLEVREARGDRMCQDALQELKMAIKASGEHKQKVNIQIAVDGLKIRDEKSGDCLYHHPVHKISFIAQDMTDNRAFGYIYGSPENGHRFFGIKTEKAAGQVVVAMRDLFQVVFELKKKEIDEAKQSMETTEPASDVGGGTTASAASFPDGANTVATAAKSSAIDDLLGLENEISAIQAGIQQIDKITPNPPMSFQTDSMLPLNLSGPQSTSQPVVQQPAQKKPVAVMNQNPASEFGTAPFLPPPPSKVGRRQEDRYAVFDNVQSPRVPPASQSAQNPQGFGNAPFLDSGPAGDSSMQSIFSQPSSLGLSESSAGPVSGGGMGAGGLFSQPPPQQVVPPSGSHTMAAPSTNSGSQDLASLFTDLDPLGTGKSKPFVDKKNFFNDSKAKLKMTGASEDSLTNRSEPDVGSMVAPMQDNVIPAAPAAESSGLSDDLI